MELSTQEIGNTIKHVEVANSTMKRVICMMATGVITRLMALESTLMIKELATKAIGETTISMGTALKSFQEAQNMKVNTIWETRKVKASIPTQMDLVTKENGSLTR